MSEFVIVSRVRLQRTAAGVFADIDYAAGWPGVTGRASVRLAEGIGAVTSLERSAQELRDKAARMLRMAAIYEQASMRI